MNTKQAEYRTDIARLAEDMANREARIERAMNGRDKWLYVLLISLLVGVILLLIRQYIFPVP